MNRDTLFKLSLIILVVALLVCFLFLYRYASSEGFKCLANPLAYAYNHSSMSNSTFFTPVNLTA